jgi:Na/Pi-cotransporter
MPPESFPSFLADTSRHAKHWLFDAALPLWWERGADHEGGGFHEKIGQDGQAIGKPVRVRVQARQTYVYARAGALGWTGPWQAAVRHGLTFMLSRYARPDGLFRSTLDSADESIDLYDQAFVLFALAHAYEAEGRPQALLDTAQTLLRQIAAALAHDGGGYYDGLPHQPILKSNPLMHLLEALLAWVATGAVGNFRAAALALCELATARLIHPGTGAVGELFTAGWAPLGAPEERLYEPGHQFEWAYLLLQAESLLGIKARSQAIALENFGRSFGIDAARQVALFAVNEAGEPTDRRARLWAQTERLRTSLLFGMKHLLNLLAAVALLVWGTHLVRTGILRVFGANLRHVLARSVGNRFTAALSGVGVTALVQSSTATALITSAFVGQGLISLPVALAVMLGADIGTSLIAVVFSFDLSWLSPAADLHRRGAVHLAPGLHVGRIGRVLIGLGLMLLALRLVTASTEVLTQSPVVQGPAGTSVNSDLLLEITLGAVLAVISYSSLAVVLLIATLAASGGVPLDVALGLVLGANLGSGLLAVLTTAARPSRCGRCRWATLAFKAAGRGGAAPFIGLWLLHVRPYLGDPADVVVLFHLSFNVVVGVAFMA